MTELQNLSTRTAGRGQFDCVLYEISGDSKDLFLDLLKEMKRVHGSRIVLVCRTKEERTHYAAEGWADVIIPQSQMPRNYGLESEDSVLRRAREIEQQYATKLHHHLIDRRLFFTGAPNFPQAFPDRGYVEWLAFYCDVFAFFEQILVREKVTFVLHSLRPVFEIARSRGIPAWRFEACMYQYNYIWTDSYSAKFPAVEKAFQAIDDKDVPETVDDIAPPQRYFQIRSIIRNSVRLPNLLRNVGSQLVRGAYYRIRRYDKSVVQGYSGRQWARYLLRQRWAFRRLERIAPTRWSDIRDRRYVFMPLSAEPEQTLSFWTPEYFDQISAVQQVAKELPVGTILAVKEHMIAIGNRPTEFYETLAAIPNVVLVHPEEPGINVGATARAVAAIASTAGVEAALRGIPVISFGHSTYYQFLDHVSVVRNWLDLPDILDRALSRTPEDQRRAQHDGRKLQLALERVSVAPWQQIEKDRARLGANMLASLEKAIQEPVSG